MPNRMVRTLANAALATMLLIGPVAAQTEQAAQPAPDEPPLADIISGSSLAGSFLAAQIASKNNDDETAVAFYERALALDPENDGLKQALFLALTANGKIAEAVEIGRKLPQEGDNASVVRLVLAVDSLRKKSWSKVGDLLWEDSSSNLDKLISPVIKAWAVFGSGDTGKALSIAETIEGPDWVKIVSDYHAGLIAAASGNDTDAERLLIQATENQVAAATLLETYARALEALVRTQARLGKTEDAQKTLDGGMRILSSHPPFVLLKKSIEEKKPLPPQITSATQGASELFFNVGSAIARQGGPATAQSYLQLAGYLDPKSDVVALALADVFEKQSNHKRAEKYYERVDEKSPFWRQARLEYALNLNDQDNVEEAKAVLKSLVEEAPDDMTTRLTYGAVLSQHEEYAEAAAVYDEAVTRITTPEENDWKLFYRRGIAYERLKEWEKAEPNFKKAIELSPDQADVLNYLGYSWVDMGIHLDEGIELIRKAVELKPRSGFIVDSLGWAHFRLGRYEDAVRDLERAVELMPQDPVVNDHLGDAYWMVGRKLEAVFQWKHALDDKPEPEQEAKLREKLEKGLDEEKIKFANDNKGEEKPADMQ